MKLFSKKTHEEKQAKIDKKQAKKDEKYNKKLKNLKALYATDLRKDESILYYISGSDGLKGTHLVLTETRVIFKKVFDSTTIDLDKITSVEKGLIKLKIKGSNTEIEMDVVTDGDVSTFVEKMNEVSHNAKQPIQKESNYIDDLKGLKELLDLDVITQDEFDAKKKELLNL